ncbi:DUF1697 domain-containing protein [Sphingomonas sp. MMS24-JH45]
MVLLRAINVGGRQARMAKLRAACEAAGFARSLLCRQRQFAARHRAPGRRGRGAVEALVVRDFGFASDAIARDVDQWRAIVAAAPFVAEREARANMVHLCLSKRPLAPDAATRIAARAQAGEQVVQAGDAMWIDFAAGVAWLKLTPALRQGRRFACHRTQLAQRHRPAEPRRGARMTHRYTVALE